MKTPTLYWLILGLLLAIVGLVRALCIAYALGGYRVAVADLGLHYSGHWRAMHVRYQ
jgi:hypothetical protein